MTLSLKLFEHLQVADNALPIPPVLRPRAQRLLAYLLLHRHTPLTRERIAFTLWPDSPEKESLGTLRRALSDLRAALPAAKEGEWIITAGGTLRWTPAVPYWLDVEAFERLIRQATPATLHDAVALYTGDLLAEWDDEWVLVERERLRQMHLNALHQLVAHHRALGEYATALNLARQALALDPLAEAAHRELITLHYEAGDRAAALAAYDRLRILLHNELGVEPMAETEALRAAIAQGAPLPTSETLTAGPVLASPSMRALPKLIGREGEMAKLGALWESAAAGRGRLAIVSGEAGVGKSHLVLTLAEYADRRGGLALVGHCYEFEHALPYQAIVEMLRSAANLLRHADLSPTQRAMLARLVPDVLGAAGSPPTEGEGSSADLRTQLFEALLHAFLAVARNQPLLLLFEDVQWAAESTLDWLTYVAPRMGVSRLLVVITYRTNEVGAKHALARLRRRFAREGIVSALSLKPLSHEANRELITHLSGLEEKRAVPVADRLFMETGGNPFFLQELVRGLIEAGQIIVRNGQWAGAFVEAAPGAEILLPDSVRETIKARVERLPETPKLFIHAAAVAGRVFRYEVIQQAGGWIDEQALEALEDLLARGLIRQSEAEGGFAFAHHLMQEAIYADLPAPRRAYWHRRLAEAVQALHLDDFEALAYHFAQAGEREKAIEYARHAAWRAAAMYAYDEAVQYLHNALDLIEDGAQPETRLVLLEQMADVRSLQGEYPQAIPLYQAALELWPSLAGADKMVAACLHRKILQTVADMRRWSANFEHFKVASQAAAVSRASLEAALQLEEGAQPHPEMVRVLTALSKDAWSTRFPPDLNAAARYAHAAVELAECLDVPAELSAALDALDQIYGLRGLLRERVQVALRRLALSHDRQLSDLHERVNILLQAGSALEYVGEYAQALPYLLEAERLSGQVHHVGQQRRALVDQVYCWFRLDCWDHVLALEEKWRDLQRRYPQERIGPVCFAIALSASVRALRGEFDQAASLREEACAIMTAALGPPERWVRSQHY